MKWLRMVGCCLILMGLLNACVAAPPVVEETPQAEIIELQITPAVEHWLPRVAACAEGIPNLGVYVEILPRAELSLGKSDLILRLGERLASDPFVAVMGLEEIVVVAGEAVPVTSLSLESLQAIYSRGVTRWSEVPEAEVDQTGINNPLQLFTYPEGHEIERLFRRAYLQDEPITDAAQTFSMPESVQELLAMNPDGIGYLLKSQVPEGTHILDITSDQPIFSDQYVLAITETKPQGGLKALLTCLQDTP